jgi:non-ribosomal peptide synthetase component E (peptide arylation enzyme)
MAGWNFADVFSVVAEEIPDSVALIQGARRLKWRALDARAQALARYLATTGLKRQD